MVPVNLIMAWSKKHNQVKFHYMSIHAAWSFFLGKFSHFRSFTKSHRWFTDCVVSTTVNRKGLLCWKKSLRESQAFWASPIGRFRADRFGKVEWQPFGAPINGRKYINGFHRGEQIFIGMSSPHLWPVGARLFGGDACLFPHLFRILWLDVVICHVIKVGRGPWLVTWHLGMLSHWCQWKGNRHHPPKEVINTTEHLKKTSAIILMVTGSVSENRYPHRPF